MPPQGGDDADGGCPPGCQEIPLASLSQPDNSEAMQTPEVGDSGTMQVDFIVKGINGDSAYVKATAINGKPVEGDEPDADDMADQSDQEGDNLRDQAQQMSQ